MTAAGLTSPATAPPPVPTDPEPAGGSLAQGSRWLTLATLVVGAVNYGFALLLTRLLSAGSYAQFAAAQALLLTAGTVAVASVPWVLAQELARAGHDVESRRRAVWFATVTNAAQGVVAALLVLAVARSFTGWSTGTAVALATLLIFLGSTTGGWLQGSRRFGSMAALRVLEVAVKAAAGAGLALAGAGVAGAVAGFGLGALVVVAAGGWLLRADLRPRRAVLSSRRLWRSTFGVAGIQGLVSVLASVDVVLVAVLPVASGSAAGYQGSMILARVPLFLAGAVAVVAFPLFAGRAASQAALARTAVRLYLVVAVPVALALALLPAQLLAPLFPPEFEDVGSLLPWTAAAGLLIGLVELLTTFFQAGGDYARCLRRQLAGLAVSAVAVPLGWLLGGVVGLAVGALAGAAVTAVLLLRECRRTWPGSVVLRPGPVLAVALVALVLAALRPLPYVWLAAVAALLGGCAHRVFLRPDRGTSDGLDEANGTDEEGRMRILHLGFEDHRRPGSGGGSVRNRQVNSRLAGRHEITVLTTNYPGARERVEDGVRYVPVGLPLGYAPSLLSYFALLPFVARRFPADLVVEEFAAPFSTVLMPLWSRRPTLALVQWLNSREKSRQYVLPFLLFEWVGVRVYRRFVVVSEDLRVRLLRQNPRAHVDVVPNGVEPMAFDAVPVTGDDVVYLGRLERAQKGLDLLLDAYAAVADRVAGSLVLIGDGPDRDRLRAQAERLGIGHRVRFAGRVDGEDKYALLASARLVAMPSRFETFGMVAVEALACGTPVLAFDIDCLRDVVPAGCGRLVPAFDVEQYAAVLAAMYADPDRSQQMGLAGRAFARQFDWDRVAVEQEQAYRACLMAARDRAATGSR